MNPGMTCFPLASSSSLTFVVAETCDDSVHDRDVDLEPFLREDGEHPPAANDEVGGIVPAGNGEPAAQLLHARSVIP